MEINNKKREYFIQKLKTILILSLILFSFPANANEADFSYFELANTKPIKLINPLYLDTSKLDKPTLKIQTSAPYYGDFDESDYFSSTIDDTPDNFDSNAPPQANSPPINEIAKPQPENNQNIIPVNDFFTPPVNEEVSPIQDADEVYSAEINSDDKVNLEGKIINKILVEGLRVIQPSFIYSKIKTQEGSLFNETLLQQDLQRLYATGYFTEQMTIEPNENEDGTIELKFVLKENLIVTDVSIV